MYTSFLQLYNKHSKNYPSTSNLQKLLKRIHYNSNHCLLFICNNILFYMVHRNDSRSSMTINSIKLLSFCLYNFSLLSTLITFQLFRHFNIFIQIQKDL